MSSTLSPLVDSSSWWTAGYGNTAVTPHCGGPPPAGQIDSITGAWSGAAFDYATNTFHVCTAGGHSDSWNNQCYALQVPSGSWSVTKAQTAFPPDQHVAGYAPTNRQDGLLTAGNGFWFDGANYQQVYPDWSRDGIEAGAQCYFDGSPCSRHTYGGTCWLPTQQRVLLLSGGCWGGIGDHYVGWFDPVAGTWTRKTNLAISAGSTGWVTAYDSTRDVVYYITGLQGLGQVYKYTPATDTHVKIGVSPGSPYNSSIGGQHTVISCDGSCTYLYAIANDPGFPTQSIARMLLGQATLQPWQVVTTYGDMSGVRANPTLGSDPAMEYDADKNAFVFWAPSDPTNLSILRLADFRMNKVAIRGTPPTSFSNTLKGAWGRFRRYALHSYALFVDARQPVYLINLK